MFFASKNLNSALAIAATLFTLLWYQKVHAQTARAVTIGGAAPSAQFMRDCEQQLEPSSFVAYTPQSELRYDYSLSIDELTRRANENGPSSHKDSRVLGLNESQHTLHSRLISTMLINHDQAIACMRPRVEITISAPVQNIFISREFPQGSCAHYLILEHELTHARINHQIAEHVANTTIQAMKQQMHDLIFYGAKEVISQHLSRELEQRWLPWARQQLDAAEQMHAHIDSPAERQRMRTQCHGEIAHKMATYSEQAARAELRR